MKKFFPYILIVLILVAFFVPTHFAFGQQVTTSTQTQQDSPDNLGWLARQVASLLGWLGYYIMKIMSLFLGLAGLILNFVIEKTVVSMSSNISNMPGINIAWKVIRDLMNIVFIFMLVYEAIKLIINQGDLVKIRKFVFGIVLASLLINFSLFFTKVIIDASNIATIGFYNSIIGPVQQSDQKYGLSNAFQNAIGLQGFFSGQGFDEFKKDKAGDGSNADYNMLVIGLSASILFLITAFVFLAVTVMFVIRYIALIFLLMLAPIGFMGMALSFMKGPQKKWWDTLLGQAIFAPLYMLMTWIILILIGSGGFTSVDPTNKANWVGAVLNPTSISNTATGQTADSPIGLLLNFVLVIGAIIGSLTLTKKYATQGADQISTATKWTTAAAGGVLMGGAARIGRNTIGAGASRLERSKRFQEYAGNSKVGEMLYKGTQRTASSTFDARNTTAVKKTTGVLGTDFGKGTDKTFGKVMAEKTKNKLEFAKSLDMSKEGREAYAKRTASGLFTKGGSKPNNVNSMFGMLGRGNRMASASLLRDRLKELGTELSGYRSEFNILSKIRAAAIAGTGPALTPAEISRYDQLQGIGTFAPPAGPVGGLIQKASDDITDLKTQITSLGLDKTQAQKY